MSAASLSVSVVVYDLDTALLERCMESLIDAANSALVTGQISNWHATVVDNGGNGDILKFPQKGAFNVVENQKNVGFGQAHNQAIREAATDYHLILNPDVILPEDYFTKTIALLESEIDIVMAAPLGVTSTGENAYLCKRYPSVWVLLLRGFAPKIIKNRFRATLSDYEYRDLDPKVPEEVLLVSGCCMFARTAALLKCDGFDERFFLYFEDFDLSLRMQDQGRIMFLPSVRIVHYGGESARKGINHILLFCRSAVSFYRKHGWRLF